MKGDAMGGSLLRQGVAISLVWFALGALVCYTVQQAGGGTGVASTALAAFGADRHHALPCTWPSSKATAKRKNLVFAAVGDGWTADKWGAGKYANWDLIAVYYGKDESWDCPQCKLALRMPDSMKWQMMWTLMSAKAKDKKWGGIWEEIREQYEFVMVADDDIIMDACVINSVFETMKRRDLLVAQPSNCRGDDSDNPYWVHWQLPGMELHSVNVVEVTAPAIQMGFLDTEIRPLLKNTYSGWGLPFCFTAAAGFPHARLAVVDTVCMIHPAREPVGVPGTKTAEMSVSTRIRRGYIKPGSIYARFGELTPFETPREEQQALWKQCGFTEKNATKARMLFPPVQTMHGTVPLVPAGGWASAGGLLVSGAQPGVRLLQLVLAAALGAGGALAYLRRAKAGGGARPVLQVHASAAPFR